MLSWHYVGREDTRKPGMGSGWMSVRHQVVVQSEREAIKKIPVRNNPREIHYEEKIEENVENHARKLDGSVRIDKHRENIPSRTCVDILKVDQ